MSGAPGLFARDKGTPESFWISLPAPRLSARAVDELRAYDFPDGPLPGYLEKVEREAILAALARTAFNRTAAAKLLGVSLRTLRYPMPRLGIRDPAQDGQSD